MPMTGNGKGAERQTPTPGPSGSRSAGDADVESDFADDKRQRQQRRDTPPHCSRHRHLTVPDLDRLFKNFNSLSMTVTNLHNVVQQLQNPPIAHTPHAGQPNGIGIEVA
ncbi:hypothetical protein PQX77_013969, partial [Marasmius sp. AFHP31]